MSVYVDNAFIPFGRMIMSHMMADELDELHAMADAIGLNRRWFQGEGHSIPHYDVSKGLRLKAIELGAIPEDIYSDSMVAFRREWRRRARHSVRIWNAGQGRVPREAQLVDRTTPYGNPFRIGRDGTREEVVRKHQRWIWRNEQLQLRIMIRENLRGVDLVCHCVPLNCHAYTVAEIANDPRFNRA